jgi:hypothetical protein
MSLNMCNIRTGTCADAQQGTPRPLVNVTFYVEGTTDHVCGCDIPAPAIRTCAGVVNVFSAHYDLPRNATAQTSVAPPPPDVIHKLMDLNPNGTATASVTVDFAEMDDLLVTGDRVAAPVTLTLTVNQANRLGLSELDNC